MEKVCEAATAEEVSATMPSQHETHETAITKADAFGDMVLEEAVVVIPVLEVEESPRHQATKQKYPLWRLVVSAIPWIGIQALWSTEFAVTTPYMKDLGMTDAWSSDIWVFGPITGFLTAPVVGCLSDNCQSRFGRRRPFIVGALIILWVASLAFASSGHIFSAPYSKWFALLMFIVLDVVINVVQTPVRAIVSDMASQEQQLPGQVISVLFQGLGNLLGFGIMKLWPVPYKSIFELMILVLVILTVFIGIQLSVCKEEQYKPPEGASPTSLATPFIGAFKAIRYMSIDLQKIAFVQFFSWYSLFCYWPTLSTWFSVNVFSGSADAPEHSLLRDRYEAGQSANVTAGLFNSGLMVVFSMSLIYFMLKTSVPIRYLYAGCLFGGAVALILAKIAVHHSVYWAMGIATAIAVPVSAVNAFPFALVGAMNKSAATQGKAPANTGVQMGVLNIFICTPQLLSTLVVGIMREQLSASALPWVFFMAGLSFAIAGGGALVLNDKHIER